MNKTETKTCQNCTTQFTIAPEDFAFYERVKVPPPTWCPGCRFQRRLSFENFTNLYKRPCDLCKKDFISIYTPDASYTVYCPDCWWSDRWDPYDYGREYDFSRPFFEQWDDLLHNVPLVGLANDLQTVKDSPYNNNAGHLKNCYLLFHADFNEDCAYGVVLWQNKATIDSSLLNTNELLYDCMNSFKCSRCVGSRNQVTESLECFFCRDIHNSRHCFASANLRNKKYYIFNKPYAKEDYFKEIAKWNLGSYKVYQEAKALAEEHWKKFPPRPHHDDFSVNSTGNYVFQSKNCQECFETVGAEDSKYLFLLPNPPIRDCYDMSVSWGNNVSLTYEATASGENASNLRFCQNSGIGLHNAEYCKLSLGKASNHFGCVSIKNGDYVILNKRYTEGEFHKLREKIVNHMDAMPYRDEKGRVYGYGEFFPPEFSTFAYNQTIAQNFFPLTKEKAKEQRYRWQEDDKKEHEITKKSIDLPDHIKEAPDTVLKEVLGCQKCNRAFRIIPAELKFLREINLPLPRECPFCRINEKLAIWAKNLRVFKRSCSGCGEIFETSHPENEVAYILCRDCYQKEVV